jgi:hypothetical protein
MRKIRLILLFEAAAFFAASLVHSGVLIHGYEHEGARVAEGVIGAVLLLGFALTWGGEAWARRAALASQVFALLGTAVGLFTVIIGVGPRTVPDVIYHVAIVLVLIMGLVAMKREFPRAQATA